MPCSHCEETDTFFDRSTAEDDLRSYRRGDVVELAPDLPEAALVTLGRVFCRCPHMKDLVRATTAKASRWYAVTYPRAHWFNRMLGPLSDLYCRARGTDFRLYIHTGIDETIRDEGFSRFYRVATTLWTVAFYEREPAED